MSDTTMHVPIPPTSGHGLLQAPAEISDNLHSLRRARALADKEEAAARKAERDEEIELGQLLRTADVKFALTEVEAALRSALEALPHALAKELALITDEGQLRARMVGAVETLLTELSRRFGALAKQEIP